MTEYTYNVVLRAFKKKRKFRSMADLVRYVGLSFPTVKPVVDILQQRGRLIRLPAKGSTVALKITDLRWRDVLGNRLKEVLPKKHDVAGDEMISRGRAYTKVLGAFGEEKKFGSMKELIRYVGMSYSTIKAAVELLQKQGRIVRSPASGSTIALQLTDLDAKETSLRGESKVKNTLISPNLNSKLHLERLLERSYTQTLCIFRSIGNMFEYMCNSLLISQRPRIAPQVLWRAVVLAPLVPVLGVVEGTIPKLSPLAKLAKAYNVFCLKYFKADEWFDLRKRKVRGLVDTVAVKYLSPVVSDYLEYFEWLRLVTPIAKDSLGHHLIMLDNGVKDFVGFRGLPEEVQVAITHLYEASPDQRQYKLGGFRVVRRLILEQEQRYPGRLLDVVDKWNLEGGGHIFKLQKVRLGDPDDSHYEYSAEDLEKIEEWEREYGKQ